MTFVLGRQWIWKWEAVWRLYCRILGQGPWLWHWRKREEDRFNIDFADTEDFCLEGGLKGFPVRRKR